MFPGVRFQTFNNHQIRGFRNNIKIVLLNESTGLLQYSSIQHKHFRNRKHS